MKKAIILLLFVISSSLAAQEQTLLSGEVHLSGFGGPVVKFTNINNEFAVLVGGYGGLLINHSFLIGLGGYGLVNSLKPDPDAINYYNMMNKPRIEFGYGGVVLEYIGEPDKIIHYSLSTLIGAGGVAYNRRGMFEDDFNFSNSSDNYDDDFVFATELNGSVELNMTTFFRINLGAGYRFINGVDIVGLKDKDLSGPSANITLKFGAF